MQGRKEGTTIRKQTTIYDIAKEAGASPTTVSRVLSNSGYPVSERMRRRILEAAERLHYVPNRVGRQLKQRRSMTIGVIVPTITNPFYSQLVLGIEETAREHGYHIMLCNTHQNMDFEAHYLQMLFELQVDGIVLSSITAKPELLKRYMERGMSIVNCDEWIEDLDLPQVGFDYERGGYLATGYLLSLGHTEIAFMSAPLDRPSRKGMYNGYVRAMREAGLPLRSEWILVSDWKPSSTMGRVYEFENGRQLAEKYLQLKRKPSAVYCANDITAIGVMQHLQSYGVRIPDDLSIIGFDDIEFAQMVTPALSSVHHPKYNMGRIACLTLLHELGVTEKKEENVGMDPTIVARASTITKKV